MDRSLERPLEDVATGQVGFVPYTAFPAIEHAVERQLGAQAKFVMPERHRENFVRFLPWVALLFLPLHFGGVLLLLGATAISKLFGSGSLTYALLSAAVFLLDVVALPGLFSNKRKGWTFFVYALALGAVSNLLGLSLLGVLFSALMLWLAFQVKYHYR